MKNFDKILPKLLAIPIEVLLLQAQGIDIIFQGLVVQLVRMPPCHGGGRGFESRPVRKSFTYLVELFFLYAFFCLHHCQFAKWYFLQRVFSEPRS